MLKRILVNLKYILLSLNILLFPLGSLAQNIMTYIPVKANIYGPVLKVEVDRYFPDLEFKEYFGGLAEQESCISLKHSKCWDPRSQLLTKRERGSGIFQLTKAYREDGTLRFDSLTEMRNKYNADLKELSWDNILQRPDLQIRAMLLMTKENYRRFAPIPTTELEIWKMTDAAYNSGPSSVLKRRVSCGLAKNCDPLIWDANLEKTIVLSTKPIYGTRSPHFINNEHVELIFHKRMHKYQDMLR